MRGLAVVLLLTPVLAGCLSDGPGDERFPVAWSEKALPFGPDHDHLDRAQHRGLSTPNFEIVGHDPLVSEHYGTTAGGSFCGDVPASPNDGRRLAAVESRTDVGFTIVDVTEPTEPAWLGELVMPTTRVYDLAVAPDSRSVILVTSDLRQDALVPTVLEGMASPLVWHTACAPEPVPVRWGPHAVRASVEDPVPRPMAIVLVDLADPSQPTIVQHEPLVGNGHSVLATAIDGTTYVMVTTSRYPTPDVPAVPTIPNQNQVSVYEFYELVTTADGPRLELLSIWKPPPDMDRTPPLAPRGHDGHLAKHPGTGQLLAYAVGHHRFTVLDLTDPRQPVEIGRWEEECEGCDGWTGQLHSALALDELWDGRHYTIIGPEYAGHPEGVPSGVLWVLDTTDPADPFEVAAWTLPHEVEWSDTYMFSNHYYGVAGRTLLVSMYHAGVWAVDLSGVGSEPWTLPPSVGVFLPARDPPAPVAEVHRWNPSTEEALVLDDGNFVTFDGNGGVYVLRFDASDPAPAPVPWPIEAIHGG